MIDKRTIFEIHGLKRLGKSNREIASELGIDKDTVSKYLNNPDIILKKRAPRSSKLDPYRDLIRDLLKQHPNIRAPVVFQRLAENGFDGKLTIVKDYLRSIRGSSKKREAYIRFESAPGVQMQVDWAHFKSLSYGGFTRKLYALCVIECYSRMLYVGFTHNMKQEALHQELMNAFRFFGGCPRELVVDNMRCAVAERTGRYVRFNDAFLDFLRPLGIDPISCNIRSPHEKGKIENAVKYLRYNFFPARTFKDIADVRRQAMGWLRNTANVRVHYTTGMRPVDRFDPKALKSLPDVLPDCRETVTVLVHKDFGVRFDSNVYTAPPWTIGKRLTLKADMESIALYYKDRLIAEHERFWEKKRRIVHPRHEQQVKKFHSRLLKKRDVIVFLSLGQIAADYLEKLASANKPIEKSVSKLLALKDEYGEAGLRFALEKALLKNLIGVDYIENILYQEMTPEVRHPPVILKDETLNDIRLTSPSLAEYDAVALQRKRNDDRSGD